LVLFHVQDGKLSDFNDARDDSFLGERPEMPAAAERDERLNRLQREQPSQQLV
jgi:hypothetical protein